MKLTESQIRYLTRKVLSELFTRKSGIGLTSLMVDPEDNIDIDSYGGGDGYDFGEGENHLDEEDEENSEVED